jgi:hypothetical protein
MALGSTQPLVKMNTRDVPGGKGGRCVRLTTYHHIVPMSRNLGALTPLDPSGAAWPVMGVLYLYLYLFKVHLSCLETISKIYFRTKLLCLNTHVNEEEMETDRPNTTLSVTKNQLRISAIYSRHHAEYRTISRKRSYNMMQ